MAVRAGYVFNYFLGQSCLEINLKSLPMVVFATSFKFSLVNARVSNSPLILSRDNLCCLIYLCLRTMNKRVFVLEAEKWIEKEFFPKSEYSPSVLVQRFSMLLVLSFLPPEQRTSHVLLLLTSLTGLDPSQFRS